MEYNLAFTGLVGQKISNILRFSSHSHQKGMTMFKFQGVTDVPLFFCEIREHQKTYFWSHPAFFFVSMTYYNWKLLRILYSLLVNRQFLNTHTHIMFNISYQKKKLFLSLALIFNSLGRQSRKVIYCNIVIISSVCLLQCYGYISCFYCFTYAYHAVLLFYHPSIPSINIYNIISMYLLRNNYLYIYYSLIMSTKIPSKNNLKPCQ